MHQDQGDASQVSGAYAYAYEKIIDIRALGRGDREVNQQVKEASKVTLGVQSREIEKLDCILSKRAIRPYIYGHTSANTYVLIYVQIWLNTITETAISQPSPSLPYEPSSPAIPRLRSIYATLGVVCVPAS
jgi:hypothetical protein